MLAISCNISFQTIVIILGTSISHIMPTINSSVNFLIYCYMSNTFRRIFYSWINRVLGAQVMQEVMHSETSIAQTQANLVTVGTCIHDISPCHPGKYPDRPSDCQEPEEESPMQESGSSPDLCSSSCQERLQVAGSRASDEEQGGECDSDRMCRSMDTFVDSDLQKEPLTVSEQIV